MKRYKMVITLVLWFMIAIYGSFMVNVAYTQCNKETIKKTIDESIFATVDKSNKNLKLSYSALYGEINISRGAENKLAVYINTKPVDIRFGLGNKVLYINRTVFTNVKNKIYSFIN